MLIFAKDFLTNKQIKMDIKSILIKNNISFSEAKSLVTHPSLGVEKTYNVIKLNPIMGRPTTERSTFVSIVDGYNEMQKNNTLLEIEQENARVNEIHKQALNSLQNQINDLQNAHLKDDAIIAGNRRRVSRIIMLAIIGIFIPVITLSVAFINYTNLYFILQGVVPSIILGALSFILAAMLVVFAWVQDANNLRSAIVILPLDIVISFLIKNITNPDSYLNKLKWIATNSNYIIAGLYILLLGFYGYVIYTLINKVYSLLSDKKYNEYMNALLLNKK